MQRNTSACAQETPLATIVRLAATAATGELIAADDAVELHIYFLEGRLAWATCSTSRRTFVDHLVERHGVAADAVREVIDECQRSRRRLGETLIGWGVATPPQVRDALAAQLGEALEAATRHPGARTLFLPRRMTYDRALTFELEELLPARGTAELAGSTDDLVAMVVQALPEVLWVEVIVPGGEATREIRGAACPSDDLDGLRAALHEHAFDALALRTAAGVVLGQRLPGRAGSLWCASGPDTKLGVATTALASAVGATVAPPSRPAGGSAWREAGDSPAVGVLAAAMLTTDDLAAALLLRGDGRADGVWRGAATFDGYAASARALHPLLQAGLPASLAPPRGGLRPATTSLRAVRGPVAYHGGRLAGGTTSVWLAVNAWATQGLGWALLQTVSRQVADAQGGGA